MTAPGERVPRPLLCQVLAKRAVAGVNAAGGEASEVLIDVEVVVACDQGEYRLAQRIEEGSVDPAILKELPADLNEEVSV